MLTTLDTLPPAVSTLNSACWTCEAVPLFDKIDQEAHATMYIACKTQPIVPLTQHPLSVAPPRMDAPHSQIVALQLPRAVASGASTGPGGRHGAADCTQSPRLSRIDERHGRAVP
jgi:hypothetical protein